MKLVALALIALSFGCAPNLCQRKANAFGRCSGSVITYSEPTCESNLERCSAAEKQRMEGYVQCLEAMNECSLEATSACGARFPGALNYTCQGG